jgi:hypothetical protein
LLPLVKTSLKRNKLHRPTKAERSTAGATELLARVVETTAPSTPATIAGSLEIWLRSPVSHAICLGLTRWSRHEARLRRMPRQLLEPGTVLKVTSRLAHM